MNGLESHRIFIEQNTLVRLYSTTSLRSFYSLVIAAASRQDRLEREALGATLEELALVLVEAVAAVRGEIAPMAVKLGLFDVRLSLVALEG